MTDPFEGALRAAARRGRSVDVCPDAAQLAAYVDNGLAVEERRQVEQHAADCVRCQQHLALLGAVSVDRPDPEGARSWLPRWGWLVPFATALLVVALWTRLPDQSSTLPAIVEQTKVSEARDDERKIAPAAPPSPAASADAGTKSRNELTSRARVGARKPDTSPSQRRIDQLERQAAAAAAPPPAAVPSPPAAVLPPPLPTVPAIPETPTDARSRDADVQSRRLEVVRESAAAAPAADTAKKEADTFAARGKSPEQMQKAARVLVAGGVAPGQYRASGHRIERSPDGGRTWHQVFVNPSLTFTVTACAPDGVCWFGTTTGVVQRQTGGGFIASQLPVQTRIIAIAPETGSAARVTVEGGQQFRTDDGGTTWKSIP